MNIKFSAKWRANLTRTRLPGVALFMLILGCAQPSPIVDPTADTIPAVRQTDDDLKKKIGITQFESRSIFISKEISAVFQQNLTDTLEEECSRIRIISPNDKQYPDYLFTLPKKESGHIDNIKLVENGRLFGLQSVITGAITSINANEEDTGYLWFKDKYYFFRVQILVSAYDTETGAKLLDQNVSRDVEVDIFDIDWFRTKKRIDPYLLEEALEDIIQEISEAICDEVTDQPWKGYIISIDGKRIIVSAGEADGLLPGLILNVYHSGNIIKGVDEQQFYLPGSKAGGIKVVKVNQNNAEAIQISGGAIQSGDLVKLED